MDRFQSETYSTSPRHFRSEEAYLDWMAQQEPEEIDEPEPVEAQVLSECCAAEMRYERYDFGVCQETGCHDAGERVTCVACGDECEPLLQTPPPVPPVFTVRVPSKPISKQQGELFIVEVA